MRQGHLVGRGRHLRHRPGGADALDQDSEVGDEACEPDPPKYRMPQRRRDAVGGETRALRLVGHDPFRCPSVTSLIPFEF
jgi:hypothetical protein